MQAAADFGLDGIALRRWPGHAHFVHKAPPFYLIMVHLGKTLRQTPGIVDGAGKVGAKPVIKPAHDMIEVSGDIAKIGDEEVCRDAFQRAVKINIVV